MSNTPQNNGSHFDCSRTITTPKVDRLHPHERSKEARKAEAVDFQGAQDVPKTSGQNPGWALGNERNRPEPTAAVNKSNLGKIAR